MFLSFENKEFFLALVFLGLNTSSFLGSSCFAFGLTFMATEPVTGSHTDTGRLFYGFFVGVLTVIIRSINPAYPEGIMLAILLMNVQFKKLLFTEGAS